jgi:cobalamin biosynthetic protein CobC
LLIGIGSDEMNFELHVKNNHIAPILPSYKTIKHGGNLRQAAKLYSIPLKDWIDLSTGINPRPWRPPDIPSIVWQRLPETDDNLLPAAQHYYGCDNLLPLAGSQAAIQALPYCRQHSRIGIVSPCYAEHAHWWGKADHRIVYIKPHEIDLFIPKIDVLLLANPNNPDATHYSVEQLLGWHQRLTKDNGWLIVDEAFIDSTAEKSLLPHCKTMPEGLIVLRSIGKFFGLAGIRLGFLAAEPKLLQRVAQRQGVWSVSHPARWLGQQALADQQWQTQTRDFLRQQSEKLQQLLEQSFQAFEISKNHYFCYIQHPKAEQIKQHLAQQGIWTRTFKDPPAIRFGLPANNNELQRLKGSFEVPKI